MCSRLGLEEVDPPSSYDTRNLQDWKLEDYFMYMVDEISQTWHSGCGSDLHCLEDIVNNMCSYGGSGTCLNQINSSSSGDSQTNYIIGADGNKYFWALHGGTLTLNANSYGNDPYFAQVMLFNDGGMYMRLGSGSSNAGYDAKLEELKEEFGSKHHVVNGWNRFAITYEPW